MKCPKCERLIDRVNVFPAYDSDLCRLCSMMGTDALASQTSTCWPMLSDAMAVHPDQIPAAMKRNKAHGLGNIEYEPSTGRPILKDRGMRRDLMKLECVHDKHGGYGDDH